MIPNPHIDTLMLQAMEGDYDALHAFYTALLQGPFFVPERLQQTQITNADQPNNPFSNLLGLRDGERTIVPVFTKPEHMLEWSQRELAYKTLSGMELLKLMPEEWWFCINPGSECAKEMSPWEISELRGGPGQIPAVINEHLAGEHIQPVTIFPIEPHELRELRTALIASAQLIPSIEQLYLMREKGSDEHGVTRERLLIGIETAPQAVQHHESIQDKIAATAASFQIGGDDVHTLIAAEGTNRLVLGLFRQVEPIFSRSTGRTSTLGSKLSAIFTSK